MTYSGNDFGYTEESLLHEFAQGGVIPPVQLKPQQRSQRIATDVLENLGEQLESEYREERRNAAENLFNSFAECIKEQNPDVETTLYVVEMLKMEVLQKRREIEFEPAQSAHNHTHKKKKSGSIGAS